MVRVNTIVKKLEEFAPLEYACDWDNSGWQVKLHDDNIESVTLALSPNLDVMEQAIENKSNLLVTHHPLIFGKLNKISVGNHVGSIITNAIQNKLQIYSAHTNLDSAKGGVADVMAEMLNLKSTMPIEQVSENVGIGRIGQLQEEVKLDAFLAQLKKVLNAENLKVTNNSSKQVIKNVALCPGSGSDLVNKLKSIDIFITGDVKYHTAIDVDDIILVDAGHFETERLILPTLKDLIKPLGLSVHIAEEKLPWDVI